MGRAWEASKQNSTLAWSRVFDAVANDDTAEHHARSPSPHARLFALAPALVAVALALPPRAR